MVYEPRDDDPIFPVSKSYMSREITRGSKLAGVKRIRVLGWLDYFSDFCSQFVAIGIFVWFVVLFTCKPVAILLQKIYF